MEVMFAVSVGALNTAHEPEYDSQGVIAAADPAITISCILPPLSAYNRKKISRSKHELSIGKGLKSGVGADVTICHGESVSSCIDSARDHSSYGLLFQNSAAFASTTKLAMTRQTH
jgi:hypothetical protein